MIAIARLPIGSTRQGSDWVDQMLLGGMLKSAEYGYRMIFELVDTHSDHVESAKLARRLSPRCSPMA